MSQALAGAVGLIAPVLIPGVGGDGQRDDLDQPFGNRLIEGFGELHESQQGIGLKGCALEELSQVSKPRDPRCQRLPKARVALFHFTTGDLRGGRCPSESAWLPRRATSGLWTTVSAWCCARPGPP